MCARDKCLDGESVRTVCVVTLLVHVFKQQAGGAMVEALLVERIARLSLEHPAAKAVRQHIVWQCGLLKKYAGLYALTRGRFGSFLADELGGTGRSSWAPLTEVVSGEVGAESTFDYKYFRMIGDCCGSTGRIAVLCSLCKIAFCVRCYSHRLADHTTGWRRWEGGVGWPLCMCHYDANGDRRLPAQDALCMVCVEETPDEESASSIAQTCACSRRSCPGTTELSLSNMLAPRYALW